MTNPLTVKFPFYPCLFILSTFLASRKGKRREKLCFLPFPIKPLVNWLLVMPGKTKAPQNFFFFFPKNIIFIFLSPKLILKNWVGGGRSQDTKFPSCGTHLMYGNFFTSRPYCELGFWVCSSRNIHRFCGSSLPDYCILTHWVQLERKGVFSAANLLKRGVKRKRKLIGLCLAKVSFFILFIRILKDWVPRNTKIARTLTP